MILPYTFFSREGEFFSWIFHFSRPLNDRETEETLLLLNKREYFHPSIIFPHSPWKNSFGKLRFHSKKTRPYVALSPNKSSHMFTLLKPYLRFNSWSLPFSFLKERVPSEEILRRMKEARHLEESSSYFLFSDKRDV